MELKAKLRTLRTFNVLMARFGSLFCSRTSAKTLMFLFLNRSASWLDS